MNCYQCEHPFDAERYVPKLLPRCGHTICLTCFTELIATSSPNFKCPFDNIIYSKNSEFPDNLQFLEQTKPKISDKSICRKHEKKLELFCKNCQEAVCSDCALFGGHKFHDVEQMVQKKIKLEQKIKLFRQKVGECQKTINFKTQDLSNSIVLLKKEKTEQIENNFKELLDVLNANKKHIILSLNQFYDKLSSSLGIIKNKLNEIDSKIFSSQIESELTQNPSKERIYEKEIEEIESTINSKLMINTKIQQEIVNLSFDKTLLKNCKTFCKMICNTEILDSEKKKNAVEKKEVEEENLLHQSFRDILKNATESLFLDEELTVEESVRYKTQLLSSPTPIRHINELKNYSPLSGLSKNNGLGNMINPERSMLKRTPSGMAVNHENYTQKKSLNGTENEEVLTKKGIDVSPGVNRQSKLNDCSSIKSTSTNKNNAISLYQFNEKENLTGSQANTYTNSVKTTSVDQLNALIDVQIKSKSDLMDLSGIGLNDKMIEKIAKRFSQFKGFKTLKLNNNGLTEVGLKGILREIKDLHIEFIFLTENNLKEMALDYLISYRKYNASLRAVYMSGNPMPTNSIMLKKKVKLLDEKNILVVI